MKTLRNLLTFALVMVFASIPLGIAPAFAEGDVAINATNFPDEVFREYVKGFDKDSNGKLSQNELDAVEGIDVKEKHISNLKGVEHFKQIKVLMCYKNQLTELDLSQNTALIFLDCHENFIESLDLSQNTALVKLVCYKNFLTELNLPQSTALLLLECHDNQLESLDVSKNTALEGLACEENNLKALDLRQNRALEYLDCRDNQLESLDISQNTALGYLSCGLNRLDSLDVSQHRALEYLSCGFNQLDSLNVSQNRDLEFLYCSGNRLDSLDLSKNTALIALHCYENQLSSLDLSKNSNIEDDRFSGEAQKYPIEVDKKSLTFDLTSLPGDFDVAKASDWVGGRVSGTTLTVDSEKPAKVTYRYEAREGKFLEVTLDIHYTDAPLATMATISFDAGGGSGTMANKIVKKDSAYTLTVCTFTAPENKTFKAWEVGGEEKMPGETITIKGNTTVKALWAPASSPKPAEKIEVRLRIGSDMLVQNINGTSNHIIMDVVPYIKEGRTMLPIRFIAESLGLEVQWIDDTRTVILKGKDYSAEIPVDTNKIIVGGITYEKDVKPEIKYGRTMLPLRHVAESLGFDVQWIDDTRTVIITGKN